MSTVIADILESEESARRLESDLASWRSRAEKAEAEVANLLQWKERAENALEQLTKVNLSTTEKYEAKLEACRALVARLDEMENLGEGFPFHGFQGELNAAREALKVG